MQTSLFDRHKALGAKVVDFAGWKMPVEYSGIREEHLAVRGSVGLFDVSHMGEIEIRGPGTLGLIQKVTCNDAARLKPGRSHYSALLTPRGTFVDDLIVYRLTEGHFLLCVNASNKDKDFEWIHSYASRGTEVRDASDEWALLALQGPRAREILPSPLKKTEFEKKNLNGIPVLLSCTGYTGEDGYEIFSPWSEARRIWDWLMEIGRPMGLLPCGLGARDSLRIEAGYPLYGHEIDDETTPYEVGLSWIVKLEKGDFLGREALLSATPTKDLVGVSMKEPGIPRQGFRLFDPSGEIGRVTSGTYSPTFQKGVALARVTPPLTNAARDEKNISIDIRGKKREAMVVKLPFYKRPT